MKKIMKILSVVIMIGVVSYVVPDTICNVSAVTSVYGDVNNDGIVSSADIVCMNKLLNGNLGVTEAELAKFDLNGNMIVSKTDGRALVALIAGA